MGAGRELLLRIPLPKYLCTTKSNPNPPNSLAVSNNVLLSLLSSGVLTSFGPTTWESSMSVGLIEMSERSPCHSGRDMLSLAELSTDVSWQMLPSPR